MSAFISVEGLLCKILRKKSEGFVKMLRNQKKSFKNLNFLEKSLDLEIEYLKKYNSFSKKFSPLDQELNPPYFNTKFLKL